MLVWLLLWCIQLPVQSPWHWGDYSCFHSCPWCINFLCRIFYKLGGRRGGEMLLRLGCALAGGDCPGALASCAESLALGAGCVGAGGGGERLRMLGRVSPRSSVYPLPAQSLSHWGRGKEDARASGLLSRSPLPALVHDPSPAAAATATAALLEFAALLHSTLVSLTLHPGFFPRQWVPQHSPFLRQREINSLHRHVK